MILDSVTQELCLICPHLTALESKPTPMSSPAASDSISLKIEFSGGLELLFSNQRSHRLTIPALISVDNSTTAISDDQTSTLTAVTGDRKPADVTYLVHHLRDHLLKERVEFFMENGTV
jgi:ubiquitin related modifier 1